MDEFIFINKVYLKKNKYGYGVYAKEELLKGDIIEKGVMTILNDVDGNKNPNLFTWSEDRKLWAMGSGYLSFYNFSYEPNAIKKRNFNTNTLTITADNNIKKDEEITTTYFSKKWRECFQDF